MALLSARFDKFGTLQSRLALKNLKIHYIRVPNLSVWYFQNGPLCSDLALCADGFGTLAWPGPGNPEPIRNSKYSFSQAFICSRLMRAIQHMRIFAKNAQANYIPNP